MGDPIAIASIILAVGTTLGGLFGYWHLKLKSDGFKLKTKRIFISFFII
jgi:hypothetical protein